MNKTLKILAGAALLAVFAFFGSLTVGLWEVWSLRGEVGKAIAARIDPALSHIISASDAVTKTATEVPKQVTDLSDKVLAQTKDITDKADAQLTDIRGTVDSTVTKADAQLTALQSTALKLGNKADPVIASTTRLLDASTGLVKTGDGAAKHVADALPQFTDCAYYDGVTGEPIGGNEDCLFNRFQGTSKALEKLAQAGAEAAPVISKQVERIGDGVAGLAQDGKREADELLRPKTWKEQLKDYVELISFAVLKIL